MLYPHNIKKGITRSLVVLFLFTLSTNSYAIDCSPLINILLYTDHFNHSDNGFTHKDIFSYRENKISHLGLSTSPITIIPKVYSGNDPYFTIRNRDLYRDTNYRECGEHTNYCVYATRRTTFNHLTTGGGFTINWKGDRTGHSCEPAIGLTPQEVARLEVKINTNKNNITSNLSRINNISGRVTKNVSDIANLSARSILQDTDIDNLAIAQSGFDQRIGENTTTINQMNDGIDNLHLPLVGVKQNTQIANTKLTSIDQKIASLEVELIGLNQKSTSSNDLLAQANQAFGTQNLTLSSMDNKLQQEIQLVSSSLAQLNEIKNNGQQQLEKATNNEQVLQAIQNVNTEARDIMIAIDENTKYSGYNLNGSTSSWQAGTGYFASRNELNTRKIETNTELQNTKTDELISKAETRNTELTDIKNKITTLEDRLLSLNNLATADSQTQLDIEAGITSNGQTLGNIDNSIEANGAKLGSINQKISSLEVELETLNQKAVDRNELLAQANEAFNSNGTKLEVTNTKLQDQIDLVTSSLVELNEIKNTGLLQLEKSTSFEQSIQAIQTVNSEARDIMTNIDNNTSYGSYNLDGSTSSWKAGTAYHASRNELNNRKNQVNTSLIAENTTTTNTALGTLTTQIELLQEELDELKTSASERNTTLTSINDANNETKSEIILNGETLTDINDKATQEIERLETSIEKLSEIKEIGDSQLTGITNLADRINAIEQINTASSEILTSLDTNTSYNAYNLDGSTSSWKAGTAYHASRTELNTRKLEKNTDSIEPLLTLIETTTSLNELNTRGTKEQQQQTNVLLQEIIDNPATTGGAYSPEDFDNYITSKYNTNIQTVDSGSTDTIIQDGVNAIQANITSIQQATTEQNQYIDNNLDNKFTEGKNTLMQYFTPSFTYTDDSCILSTTQGIDIYGYMSPPSEISWCQHMDFFTSAGTWLFIFANLFSIRLFLSILTGANI